MKTSIRPPIMSGKPANNQVVQRDNSSNISAQMPRRQRLFLLLNISTLQWNYRRRNRSTSYEKCTEKKACSYCWLGSCWGVAGDSGAMANCRPLPWPDWSMYATSLAAKAAASCMMELEPNCQWKIIKVLKCNSEKGDIELTCLCLLCCKMLMAQAII